MKIGKNTSKFACLLLALFISGCGYGRNDSTGSTVVTIDGGGRQEPSNARVDLDYESDQVRSLAPQMTGTLDNPTLKGGIMVYFKGLPDSDAAGIELSFHLSNEFSTHSVEIPNGKYHVLSVGYGAPGVPNITTSGDLYCGYSSTSSRTVLTPVVLDGLPKTVSFTLVNRNNASSPCWDSVFGVMKIVPRKCTSGTSALASLTSLIPSSCILAQSRSEAFTRTNGIGILLKSYESKNGQISPNSFFRNIVGEGEPRGIGSCIPLQTDGSSTHFTYIPTGLVPNKVLTHFPSPVRFLTQIFAFDSCPTAGSTPPSVSNYFSIMGLSSNTFFIPPPLLDPTQPNPTPSDAPTPAPQSNFVIDYQPNTVSGFNQATMVLYL